MRKGKQFYILTTPEVIDNYESLPSEEFMRSLYADDIKAVVIGDINTADSQPPNEWLWILENEIKYYILKLTNNQHYQL